MKGTCNMKRNIKYTSAEDVRRENRRNERNYWLYSLVMAVLVGILATSLWWGWVLLGLFIESFN